MIHADDRRGWQRACDAAPILLEVMFWGFLLGQLPGEVWLDELMIVDLDEEPLREDPWQGRHDWK